VAMDGAHTLELRQSPLLLGSYDIIVIGINLANVIINLVALFSRRSPNISATATRTEIWNRSQIWRFRLSCVWSC
jgi:hypothetical protein